MPGAQAPLWCARCGASFEIDRIRGVRYACGACGAAVVGAEPDLLGGAETLDPSGPSTRTLYPRRLDAPPPPRPRRLGRYVIHDEIGRGGMGVVYRAFDPERGRFVALKVLLSGDHASPEQIQRFLREAEAASRLDHPNLVPVHDTGWADGSAYLVMALVDGPSLDVLRMDGGSRAGPLPIGEAVRIAHGLARGLAHAHAVGLVHRDVKPANVLLTQDGTPLLGDFGLATELHGSAQLTRTGQLLGTPTYMAPEQAGAFGDPSPRATPRSDQYSLGAVLYEMLTGATPYEGADALAVLRQLMAGPPLPARQLRPEIPPRLAWIVETAMAWDPEHRYPDMQAFADDLGRFQRGEPVLAQPPSLGRRWAAGWRRHQAKAFGVVAAVMGLLLGVQGVGIVRQATEQQRELGREREALERLAVVQEQVAGLRTAGDLHAAAAALERFAAAPPYVGTRAATAAQLDRARMLTEASDKEALDAWAAAYAGARSAAGQDPALRGLAAHFAAAWQWSALDGVVESLLARSPAAASDPGVGRWRAQAALATGQPDRAASAAAEAGLSDVPLLSALREVDRVEAFDGQLLIGEGGPWAWRPGEREVRRLSPDGTLRRIYALPAPVSELLLVDGPEPMLVARHPGEDEAVLYTLGEVPEAVARWSAGQLLAAAKGREGEIWVGLGPHRRQLVRLSPAADARWRADRPVPAVDATASDVSGVAVTDTDGDGEDELVVAASAWRAYDLRVVDPASGDLLARRKLGQLQSLIVDRHDPTAMWVAKGDRFPNRIVFSPEAPYGRLPGVYRLRRRGGELLVDRFLPSPLGRIPVGSVVGALVQLDLDGDGVDEIAFHVSDGERDGTVIVPSADPDREPWVIADVIPDGALQADGDAADELAVHTFDGTAYVIGTGHDALPARARSPRQPVPGEIGEIEARSWSRAEDLVGMGLYEAAIDELVALARAAREPAVGATAQRRAAELAVARGDSERAAALYEAIGDPESMRLAAAEHLRGHRFDEALRAARASGTEGALTDALDAQVARTRSLSLDLGTRPDGVEVLDPVATAEEANGLRIVALADRREPILRVPFSWDGDRLGLEVVLDLQRLEWAGGVSFSLVGPEDAASISISGWGGGERLRQQIGCDTSLGGSAQRSTPRDGPEAGPQHLRLSIDLSTLASNVRCRLQLDESVEHRDLPLARPLRPGAWALLIAPTRHGGIDAPAAAEILLRSVTLTATGLGPGQPGPVERSAVAEAVALADAGRAEEAVAALGRLSDPFGEESRDALARALRIHPATFGPALRTAFGSQRYFALFERAFGVLAHAHPDDRALVSALTTRLDGIEQLGTSPDPAARGRAASLLAARGQAWAVLGHAGAARADLRRVTRIDAPPSDDPPDALASVWVELAALAAAEGSSEEALAAVRSAMAASGAPEITADQVRASPALAALAATPSWAEILGP